MSLLIVLGIVVASCVCSSMESGKSNAPAVKDWDAFNRDTIGMSAKEIKKGVHQGRW